MKIFTTSILLIYLSFPFLLYSQTDTVALSAGRVLDIFRPNSTIFIFDNSLNTYRWDGNIFYNKNFSDFEVLINEQYKSSLIQTTRKLIRDEQNLNFNLYYKLLPYLRTATRVSSLILTDNQSDKLGSVTSHSFYSGLEYKPTDEITLEPMVGMRYDKQLNQADDGFSYLFNAKADNFDIANSKIFLLSNFEGNYLSPRKLETQNISLSFKQDFFQQTRNVLNLIYRKNLREFYFTADPKIQLEYDLINNIEKRDEKYFSAFDTLDYYAGNGLQFSLNGTASIRDIDRSVRYKPLDINDYDTRYLDNNIHDFKIEGIAQIKYEPSESFGSQLQVIYSERDVKHSLLQDGLLPPPIADNRKNYEERKNNISRRTTVSASMNFSITENHRVALSGSSSILRYDTPSKENDDDRDELWMAYNLTTYHRINKYFSFQIPMNAYLTHIVYLLGTRSANNNWNRIIRLAPRFAYFPFQSFSTTNIFEVLANYTAYDFEDRLTSVKSFSFRQFSFVDSSYLSLSKKIGVDWYNNVRLYERGELNWKAFKGRPINYFEDKTYITQLRYTYGQYLLFSTGIRYFSQSTYNYEGKSKRLLTFLRSIGPIASIIWTIESKTELLIRGFYEKIEYTRTKTHSSTNLLMNIKIYL
jgi:hypothetical protein